MKRIDNIHNKTMEICAENQPYNNKNILLQKDDLYKLLNDNGLKDIEIKNIEGQEFIDKYGFKCPLGVQGRNSDNKLYREKVGWEVSQPLSIGLKKTYNWIKSQVDDKEKNTPWIYESPDNGKTVYRREPQSSDRHKIK